MINLGKQLEAASDWYPYLKDEVQKPYFETLNQKVGQAYLDKTVYPPEGQIFNALETTPLSKVKVVILGQDPYHNPNQAHGLAFSVNAQQKIPPSLQNIFKEISANMHCIPPTQGDLTYLAEQGVLLLNTVLTVEENSPQSHAKWGWENFTDTIIQQVSDKASPSVFILWGKPAQTKSPLINREKHLILQSVHPSPLSAYRGFHGSKPFSQANHFLEKNGRSPIDWCGTNQD